MYKIIQMQKPGQEFNNAICKILGGKGCLQIRPIGVVQLKQPPYIKHDIKSYTFFQ